MKRVLRQKILDGSLLGLAVVAGVVVVVTHRWQSNRPSDEPTDVLIPALAEAQPSSLVLTRDGRSVQIVNSAASNDSSTWMVESPWKRSADQATLDAVVAAVRDMQIVRRIQTDSRVAPDDLVRLGLDHPNFTWQIVIDGSRWSLAFGAEAPLPRGGTYVDVTRPGSNVHQFYVANVELSKLALLPEQLVEPRLIPYVPSDFGSVMLESGSNRASFRFDATRSRWFEADGQRYRVSKTAFDSLLLQVTTLKGEKFLTPSESAAKHWVRKTATITLGLLKAQTTIRLEFGGSCDGQPNSSFVAITGSEDFTACADTRALVTKLEGEPTDWEDSQLFSVRPDEFESLDEVPNGQPLHLERWESAFRITGGAVHPIDLETGNQWLSELLSTRGKLVNSSTQVVTGFDAKNFVRVSSAVIGDSDHYEERVLFGPALANGDRYVKRDADGAILRISASAVRALLLDENRLKATTTARDEN